MIDNSKQEKKGDKKNPKLSRGDKTFKEIHHFKITFLVHV
jgi:hypothetical protein